MNYGRVRGYRRVSLWYTRDVPESGYLDTESYPVSRLAASRRVLTRVHDVSWPILGFRATSGASPSSWWVSRWFALPSLISVCGSAR